MGAFKRAAIAAMENGKRWGALELYREHMIPECLHDRDKPQMKVMYEGETDYLRSETAP